MARPRKPTRLLLLNGAFKKNPRRKREEPKCNNALKKTPPSFLNTEQKAAWRKILKTAPQGVLMNSDELIVAMTAILWAEFITDPKSFTTAKLLRLEMNLGRLGMSPCDRAKLAIPTPKKANKFDQFK